MDGWQLVVLGGAVSTVTAAVVQWWQGRQARDRQDAEFAHLRQQQQDDFAEQRARQREEWDLERQDRLDLEQRSVLRDLQAEAFALEFAARELSNQNVELARSEAESHDRTITIESRKDASRRFESARARVYILGASVRDEETRGIVEVIIREAESLAFTPREHHGRPDPFFDIVNQRNLLNRRIGRILRGGPGLELADGAAAGVVGWTEEQPGA